MFSMTSEPEPMDQGRSTDPLPNCSTTDDAVNWATLVDSIRNGEPQGMADLYRLFEHGVRMYVTRRVGLQELDDKVHDVFLIVVEAIQRGEVREPERLMGYVRTVVRRQVAAHIGEVVQSRRGEWSAEGPAVRDQHTTPEQDVMESEEAQLMHRILGGMSARDREILERFYLEEQSQEMICAEMGLSDTQFRLLKCRAKQRFGEMGRRRLEIRAQAPVKPRNIFLRTFDRFRHY